MNLSRSYKKQKTGAQAMLEFALALPVLLTLIYGVLETGRLLFIYASTVTAARQAVRYGSATGIGPNGVPYYQDCTGIMAAAKSVGFINRFEDDNIDITYDGGLNSGNGNPIPLNPADPACGAFTTVKNGDRILVTVSTEWQPIVNIIPFEAFTIESESSRTILASVSIAVTAIPQGWVGTNDGILYISSVTADVPNNPIAGQSITYTYTLTNTGSDDLLSPFSVVDSKANASCLDAPPILGANASFTCTGTYFISQEDIDNGAVVSQATASSSNGTSNTVETTVVLNQLADMEITKSALPQTASYAGQEITYTYQIENTGNVTLTSQISVTDNKIGTFNCPSATLAPGATLDCQANYSITAGDLDSLVVVNEAYASIIHNAATITSNTATETVITAPLILTVTALPSTAIKANDPVVYTYTVTNNRETPISSIEVTDSRIPEVTCQATDLAPNASTTCTGSYIISQSNMDAGTALTSTATASGDNGGQTVFSNTASSIVLINQVRALEAVLTASPTAATPPETGLPEGTLITYTYTLTNKGNVTLTNLAVSDDKATITCPSEALAPDESKDCTGSYVITADDTNAGSLINTGTASAQQNLQSVQSAQVSATVITYSLPRFSVAIDGAYTPNVINYTYTVTNTGGVPLSNYAITYMIQPTPGAALAPQAADCQLANPTLAIGASTTCTSSYSVPLDKTEIMNTVTAATASDGSSTIPATTPLPSMTTEVNNYCLPSKLYYTIKPASTTNSEVTWTIQNDTGVPLTIKSINIQWAQQGNPDLLRVYFPASSGTPILSPNDGTRNYFRDNLNWILPTGPTDIRLVFSKNANSIQIIITMQDLGCPVLQ